MRLHSSFLQVPKQNRFGGTYFLSLMWDTSNHFPHPSSPQFLLGLVHHKNPVGLLILFIACVSSSSHTGCSHSFSDLLPMLTSNPLRREYQWLMSRVRPIRLGWRIRPPWRTRKPQSMASSLRKVFFLVIPWLLTIMQLNVIDLNIMAILLYQGRNPFL